MSASTAETLTRLFVVAVQRARHYSAEHPAADESAVGFAAAVAEELSRAPTLRFDASGEWLMVQGRPLPPEDRYAPQLREHLRQRRAARLILQRGVSPAHVRALVRLLALEPEELIAEGGLADALLAAGASGIELERSAPPAAAPSDVYLESVSTAADLWAMVGRGEPIDVGRAHLVVARLGGTADTDTWSQVAHRGHDELDPAHAVNTAFLTLQVAQALSLDEEARTDLGVAALLHDMGIAALPAADRPMERTTAVTEARPRHTVEGGYLLRHVGGRESLAMVVAIEHHDAAGERGASMMPHSRLVALADHVDAMTCGRAPGLRSASLGNLLSALLAGEGPAFDPIHVRALCAILREAAASGAEIVQPG